MKTRRRDFLFEGSMSNQSLNETLQNLVLSVFDRHKAFEEMFYSILLHFKMATTQSHKTVVIVNVLTFIKNEIDKHSSEANNNTYIGTYATLILLKMIEECDNKD